MTVKTRPAGADVEISVIDRGSGIDPKDSREHLQSVLYDQERRGRPGCSRSSRKSWMNTAAIY